MVLMGFWLGLGDRGVVSCLRAISVCFYLLKAGLSV